MENSASAGGDETISEDHRVLAVPTVDMAQTINSPNTDWGSIQRWLREASLPRLSWFRYHPEDDRVGCSTTSSAAEDQCQLPPDNSRCCFSRDVR